jgi:isoquinoline 1-oxidoreductase
MSEQTNDLRLEKFELSNDITRREAAKRLQAGILFLFTFRKGAAGQSTQATNSLLSSRLHVGEDGTITVLTGKVECGQGIRTTLTQAAAEELHTAPGRVRLIMGDTDLVPDDGGTWGSLTTPQTVPVIRQACASLREYFRRYAAEQWKVDTDEIHVSDGSIRHKDGRILRYRDLTRNKVFEAATSAGAPLTSPLNWAVCGTPLPAINGPAIVRGALKYSSDLYLDGMLHGQVIRPPNYRCRLLSYDASKAASLPGVKIVHQEDFLGVVAPTAQAAAAAAHAVEAHWSNEQLGNPATLFSDLKRNAKPPDGKAGGRYPALIEAGSVEEGIARAPHRHRASYQIWYIAHVPLEARAAVAEWRGGRLTVHCGTQAPFPVRDEIAKAFEIPPEHVRVVVSDTGSGYGGKHNSECELEAARLARETDKPVRLAWSREEEFGQSYCRPAALMEVESGFDSKGVLQAWDFHNYNGGAASLTPPYRIANLRAGYHASASPLRQGSYRSLAAVGNTFARESHLDEIAASMKLDPLELRLRNIEDSRLRTVLERAAERFGWGRARSGAGVGYGFACNLEKGGRLALFTKLEVDGSQVRLRRMVAAFDAGAILNPDILSNQVEGAIVQGIGGALFEELKFNSNRITNGRLSGYRVPRFTDIPDIDVILIDRRDMPSSGAGESPITATAPSIASAIFAASGKRIRQMPMMPALAS